MMKKMMSILLAGILVVSMTGCQKEQKTGEETTGMTTGTETIVEDAAPTESGAADRSKELIVYTNSGSDGRDAWLVEKAAEAGFKIQVLNMGASDLTNRLIAEKNNAIADVVFGQNNIEYEKLKKADTLRTWKPDWVDGVDQTLIDADGYYYPVTTTPLVLICNNEMQNPPADWTDLVKDEYKGLYQIHGLDGGTGKTVFASIISRYTDPEGELGISEEGWAVARDYLGNAHKIAEGEDSIGSIISGELPMDMHWASGVLTEQKTRGYKFGVMTPDVGVPYVVESVAIVKTTKYPELAEEFLNWLGSSEIQLAWSDAFGTIPAQKDALENVTDDIKELMSVLKPQQLDWSFIAENIDAWVEKAELEYVK